MDSWYNFKRHLIIAERSHQRKLVFTRERLLPPLEEFTSLNKDQPTTTRITTRITHDFSVPETKKPSEELTNLKRDQPTTSNITVRITRDSNIHETKKPPNPLPRSPNRKSSVISNEKIVDLISDGEEIKTDNDSNEILKFLKSCQYNPSLESIRNEDLLIADVEKREILTLPDLFSSKLILVVESKDLKISLPDSFTIDYLNQKLGTNLVDVTTYRNKIKIKLNHLIAELKKNDAIKAYCSIDLNETVINQEFIQPEIIRKIPNVEDHCKSSKYCLILGKDSFIDFHTNFYGGIEWYE